MPWTATDVDKHIKNLNPSQKQAWVKIANASLDTCIKGGRDQQYCEGYAVRVANSKVKAVGEKDKVKESTIQITIDDDKNVTTTSPMNKWSMTNVEEYISDLNHAQKQTWVDVANYCYTNCMLENDNNEYCEGYAIKAANLRVLTESNKDIAEAEWTTEFINRLPDSSFGYVEPGEKDDQGKTKPRSKRHFPFKDGTGKIDLPHLRNALARAPQSPFGGKAMPKLKAAAKKMKIGEYAEDWKGGEGYFKSHMIVAKFREQLGDSPKYKPNEDKREVVLPMLVEGWGNPLDRNYYTDKAVAESVSYLQSRRKMYFNHPKIENDERDMRDWAASIQETWLDILPDGKRITMGRVKVFDDWLWERIKAAPDEIGTSVLGKGKARKDIIEGKDANVIESIEFINSCDFVDYPGNVPLGLVGFVERQKIDGSDNKKLEQEDDEMKMEDITLGMIKEQRPELIAQIEQSVVEAGKKHTDGLDNTVKEQEKEITELKKKIDEHEVIDRLNAKKALVDKLLQESKLSENAKTEVFKEVLMKCEETKKTVEGEETVITERDHMTTLIKDREILLGITENPVKNMGEGKKEKTDDDVKVQESFNRNIMGIEVDEEKKDEPAKTEEVKEEPKEVKTEEKPA